MQIREVLEDVLQQSTIQSHSWHLLSILGSGRLLILSSTDAKTLNPETDLQLPV